MVTKAEFATIYKMGVYDTEHNLKRFINDAYAKYNKLTTLGYSYEMLPSEIKSRLNLILSTYLKLFNLDPIYFKPLSIQETGCRDEIQIHYCDERNNTKSYIDVKKNWFDMDESQIFAKINSYFNF